MAKSKSYWVERFTQLEESLLNIGQKNVKSLDRQYQLAMARIEKEILRWYTRLAANNDISLAEAKKILNSKELKEFKWDVFEYIKYGEENALNQQWMKQLENASARVHITKLEAMKVYLQHHVEVLYGNQTEDFNTMAQEIFKMGYYHTAYEIQKGFNIGWDLFPLDTNRITKVISKPWAIDNRNFSSRIWGNKTQLINTLHTQLTQSIVRGESPHQAINMIVKEFNVSKHKAGRLVMTESAFFASAAQKDCFNDLDVEKYEIVSTLDNRTSTICQDLDGKVFNMKEYEVGVTAPPFHPYCRTTTVPYFEDDFGERAARNAEGKVIYIPSNITFKEWKKKFVA
ncbi:minor capsid protein [Bacillus sp. Gen3]|nr:minor capsid protein [Bacillus sp. Gen3]